MEGVGVPKHLTRLASIRNRNAMLTSQNGGRIGLSERCARSASWQNDRMGLPQGLPICYGRKLTRTEESESRLGTHKHDGANGQVFDVLDNAPLLFRPEWTRLRSWYQTYGRHHLPWRNEATSWHVLLAETLLHRTRAEAVEAIYPRIGHEFSSPAAVVRKETQLAILILYPPATPAVCSSSAKNGPKIAAYFSPCDRLVSGVGFCLMASTSAELHRGGWRLDLGSR